MEGVTRLHLTLSCRCQSFASADLDMMEEGGVTAYPLGCGNSSGSCNCRPTPSNIFCLTNSSDCIRFDVSASGCFGFPNRVLSVCHLRQQPTKYSRFVSSAGRPARTVKATGFFSASSSSIICAGSRDNRATIALSRLSSLKRSVPSASSPPASSTNSSCKV